MSKNLMVDCNPYFAAALDAACEICQDGGDNKILQHLLEARGNDHPQEKKVTDALREKCNNCFADGRDFSNSITATHSCLWRGKHR